MDEPEDHARLNATLDGVETVASTIYIVMLAVCAVAVLFGLGYVVLHPPTSWGSQGEWFYIGIVFILVITWIMTQAAWIIRRRRRRQAPNRPIQWMPPNVRIKPDGLSVEWNPAPSAERQSAKEHSWSWNVQSVPVATTTFKLDESQLAAARSARAAGKSWEDIAREVNPDYGFLSAFDQSLYQRMLQLAVDASP